MKPVLVFAILCVAAALAVPVSNDETNVAPATLSFEGPVQAIADESEINGNAELLRPKRFLLKKLILAKAGLLGLG